jgi:hypothetical protein
VVVEGRRSRRKLSAHIASKARTAAKRGRKATMAARKSRGFRLPIMVAGVWVVPHGSPDDDFTVTGRFLSHHGKNDVATEN